jgi:hypothetical protein
MPAHNGLWPDNRDGLEDRRKPAIQLDEEQAIAVRELDPTAHLALQHNQLLPQRAPGGRDIPPQIIEKACS